MNLTEVCFIKCKPIKLRPSNEYIDGKASVSRPPAHDVLGFIKRYFRQVHCVIYQGKHDVFPFFADTVIMYRLCVAYKPLYVYYGIPLTDKIYSLIYIRG